MGHDRGVDACRHRTERSCKITARGHRMALVREDLSLQPVLNMCVCTARKTEGSVTATRHVASGLLPRPTTGAGSSNSRLAAAGSRGATLPQVQLPKNAPLAHRFYLLT